MSKNNDRLHYYAQVVVFSLVAVCLTHVAAKQAPVINEATFAKVRNKYGDAAVDRLVRWQELIENDNSQSDSEKLEKVNNYFNQFTFVDDIDHWGKEDYWATPIEFIASAGGDCEDFSLAKYFTLKHMGVPEKRLNLTYVKALELNQAHMVMTYYETPAAEPLVLDNLKEQILPASRRSDLAPVYTFNGEGLWLAKQRGKGKFVSGADRLKHWNELRQRMTRGE